MSVGCDHPYGPCGLLVQICQLCVWLPTPGSREAAWRVASGSHAAQHAPCMASRGACIEALAAIGVHMPILESDKDLQMVWGGRWQACACVVGWRRHAAQPRGAPYADCAAKRTGSCFCWPLKHVRVVHGMWMRMKTCCGLTHPSAGRWKPLAKALLARCARGRSCCIRPERAV